jgi:hypothetical protein
MIGQWMDPGLTVSRMDFVFSKMKKKGGLELSRMENYTEDHSGFRILVVDGEKLSNPSAMATA